MRIGGAAALALALALSGCGQPDYVTDSQASVLMQVVTINDGAVLDSDLRFGVDSTIICEDEVPVELTVRNKNPTLAAGVQGNVQVNQYQVAYFRSDGRVQQGVDVPFTIAGPVAATVEVDGTTTIPIEVVRRQAKLEPPLGGITGYDVVTMIAEVTVSGRTVAGDQVSASGRLQIDFADYGDEETGCPAE